MSHSNNNDNDGMNNNQKRSGTGLTTSSSLVRAAEQQQQQQERMMATMKRRPKYSCKNCRKRKIKCDRVLPCHACCLSGFPADCEYDANDEDRYHLSQAHTIEQLRIEIEQLKRRQTNIENTWGMEQASLPEQQHRANTISNSVFSPSTSAFNVMPTLKTTTGDVVAYDDLYTIVSAIAASPADAVGGIVSQLRSGTAVDVVAASAKRWATAFSLLPKREEDELGVVGRWRSPRQESRVITGPTHHSYYNYSFNNTPSSSPSLPRSPQSWEIFQAAFIDKFLASFASELPRQGSSSSSIMDTRWLRTLAQTPLLSPQSRSALGCVATAFFGKLACDHRVSLESQSMYVKTLRLLRQALKTERKPSTGTLCTVLTLGLFEMISDTSPDGWLRHIHGAERVFEARGPLNAVAGIEHEAFLYFRLYGVIASMQRMRPSFLSHHDWKTVPWSLNPSSKGLLHHLLDHVVDIPKITSEFADIEAQLHTGLISPEEADRLCAQQVAPTEELIQQLRAWKRDWADTYPGGQPYEVPVPPEAAGITNSWTGRRIGFQLPPFIRTQGRCTGPMPNIYYPDLILAQALSIYHAALIQLSQVGIFGRRLPSISVTPDEEYDLACTICRSAEYLVLFAPGMDAGALASLFPLRVAYASFSLRSASGGGDGGGGELAWLQGLFAFVGEKTALGISRHARPDLRAGVTYGRIGWVK
ncbi:hypothetical protein VTN00DRAFT_5484 [Thermoascus crustaceus]|uniref:uncharacterized protein n=1 Tax=Thermoascus crustaceus TaxID=5088 RepID=UPI003742F2E8